MCTLFARNDNWVQYTIHVPWGGALIVYTVPSPPSASKWFVSGLTVIETRLGSFTTCEYYIYFMIAWILDQRYCFSIQRYVYKYWVNYCYLLQHSSQLLCQSPEGRGLTSRCSRELIQHWVAIPDEGLQEIRLGGLITWPKQKQSTGIENAGWEETNSILKT